MQGKFEGYQTVKFDHRILKFVVTIKDTVDIEYYVVYFEIGIAHSMRIHYVLNDCHKKIDSLRALIVLQCSIFKWALGHKITFTFEWIE